MNIVERELKLTPEDEGTLDALARVDSLGQLRVVGRRREIQHNAFFDSEAKALGSARVGFRRRVVEGQMMAVWTIKGDAETLGGVSTRSEIELTLAPDMPPALAIGALRAAARSRGARALAESVGEALRVGGLPLAEPFVETVTHRRIVDLAAPSTEVELALDHVRVVGHDYSEFEIEAELKTGEPAVLDEVRAAIEAIGSVRESDGSKLSRAMRHVSACRCSGRR